MSIDKEDFDKFVTWLREHRLPMHVTAPEIEQLLGPSAETFMLNLGALEATLKKKTGMWMETVLCLETASHRRRAYITAYLDGQQSLYGDVVMPEAGPYWIPDSKRS